MVVSPHALIESQGRLRLHASYYITKQIIPALERVISLVRDLCNLLCIDTLVRLSCARMHVAQPKQCFRLTGSAGLVITLLGCLSTPCVCCQLGKEVPAGDCRHAMAYTTHILNLLELSDARVMHGRWVRTCARGLPRCQGRSACCRRSARPLRSGWAAGAPLRAPLMPTTSPATARCVLAANDVPACAFMHDQEGVLMYAGVFSAVLQVLAPALPATRQDLSCPVRIAEACRASCEL